MRIVLSNPEHPEYGMATIPIPIPRKEYDNCMEILQTMEIGDAVLRDCKVEQFSTGWQVLDSLNGQLVNIDELDYLMKRLESFFGDEDSKFLAAASARELTDEKDLINLTFCSYKTTVVTDFSNLEKIGKEHAMDLNGGSMVSEEYKQLDGRSIALELIHKLDAVKDRRRRIGDKLNYLDETLTLEQFCEEHGIPYPQDTRKYTLRPASEEEAGLFYAMPEERDRLLGAIGHVRFDFGNSGEQFWHTWWPRGPEALNSPEFKNELTDVVNELRESMLKSLENMKRYCINHGGALVLGTYPSYGYTIETESYVYRLRCAPVRGDYNSYLSCFDKRAFESNLAEKRKELEELNERVAPFVLSVDDYGDYKVGSDEPFSYFGVDNGTALEKVFKKTVKEIPHSEQIIYESNDETFCAYELTDTRLALRQHMETQARERIRGAMSSGMLDFWKYQTTLRDTDNLLGEDGMAERREYEKRQKARELTNEPRRKPKEHGLDR